MPRASCCVHSGDRLLLISSDGRSYLLPVDRLPGGRGQGEPLRLEAIAFGVVNFDLLFWPILMIANTDFVLLHPWLTYIAGHHDFSRGAMDRPDPTRTSVPVIDRLTVGQVAAMFSPFTPRANLERDLPAVLAALRDRTWTIATAS